MSIPLFATELIAAPVTPGGTWTLAQTCEHLARAVDASLGPPLAGFRPWPAPKRVVGRFLLLRCGFVPRGVPTADAFRPAPDTDLAGAVAHLARAAAAFLAHPAATLSPHPILAFTAKRDWERFHLVHARHHFKICLSRK